MRCGAGESGAGNATVNSRRVTLNSRRVTLRTHAAAAAVTVTAWDAVAPGTVTVTQAGNPPA